MALRFSSAQNNIDASPSMLDSQGSGSDGITESNSSGSSDSSSNPVAVRPRRVVGPPARLCDGAPAVTVNCNGRLRRHNE
jgi:hypothetical protein